MHEDWCIALPGALPAHERRPKIRPEGAEKSRDREIKGLGGTTLVMADKIEDRARAAADLVIELDCDLPEYARLTLYVLGGQLMGLYAGLQKGLDPDRPRNLSRVVILKEDEERPEHAAI